jgi:hypothetical protein
MQSPFAMMQVFWHFAPIGNVQNLATAGLLACCPNWECPKLCQIYYHVKNPKNPGKKLQK